MQQLGDVVCIEEGLCHSSISIGIEADKDSPVISRLFPVYVTWILGSWVIRIGCSWNDDTLTQEGSTGVGGLPLSATITFMTQVVPHVICSHCVTISV